jgi:ribosomal protein L7/L12
MTETEATDRVRAELSKSEIEAEVTLVEAHDFGWVIYYESSEFLRHGNTSDQLAGNAPMLVEKHNGKIHTLGTARPVSWYVANFVVSGDPHAEPGCVVELESWDKGAAVVSAIQAVRNSSGLGLLESKRVVEGVLNGQKQQVTAVSREAADELVGGLLNFGFRSRRVYTRGG